MRLAELENFAFFGESSSDQENKAVKAGDYGRN
jgi:hypothetical protein